ncbi:MAG: DUF1559 domain-containing protein [bacterium]|nr:DUF1559 domain-containing protein [bacterium]
MISGEFVNDTARRKMGFTLIELLVVIAIIALLAAILFPVFNSARESARKATCQSNLKQITTALHMYCEDWDRFPHYSRNTARSPYSWVANLILGKYIAGTPNQIKDAKGLNLAGQLDSTKPEGVLVCPSQDNERSDVVYNGTWFTSKGGTDYGINPWITGDAGTVAAGAKWCGIPDVPKSADVMLLTEADCKFSIGLSSYVASRHTQGVNVAYVDGHVAWMRTADIPVKAAWNNTDPSGFWIPRP